MQKNTSTLSDSLSWPVELNFERDITKDTYNLARKTSILEQEREQEFLDHLARIDRLISIQILNDLRWNIE